MSYSFKNDLSITIFIPFNNCYYCGGNDVVLRHEASDSRIASILITLLYIKCSTPHPAQDRGQFP